MGLISKFLVLVSLLSAAVVMNIIAATWSISMLERELSWPLVAMQATLDSLHDTRSALITLELADHDGALTPTIARDRVAEAKERLAVLEDAIPVRMRIGISTSANLHRRLDDTAVLVEDWSSGRPGALERLHTSFRETTRLIERVERQVIEDAAIAVDFGDRLRRRVRSMIVLSVLLTLATIALSSVFVRRWVLQPVEELRRGARRFAEGDLTHRVDVDSPDQMGRLASDFNAMASTIDTLQTERIERERLAAMGEMLRRVVHNLRTPLTGIRGLAESTREEVPKGSDAGMMQGRIIASVDRFESWLRELLKASTPLRVHVSPVRLGSWIGAVIEGRTDAARAKGVTLRMEADSGAPDLVEIDAEQLAHAAVAVLDNAIDATGNGGVIEIRIASTEGSESWTLEFSDEGGGIAEEDRNRLFEPSFTTKPRGTGIGLAMARSIVDAHRGRIEVETRRGPAGGPIGTRFRITIPVHGPPCVANPGQ